MEALKTALAIYALIFLVYGRKNICNYLMFISILAIPLQITYNFTYVLHKGWIDGVKITIGDCTMLILLLYLLIFRRGTNKIRLNSTMNVSIIMFIFAASLSMLNSSSGTLTLLMIYLLVKNYFLYYVVTALYLQTEADIRRLYTMLAVALFPLVVYGCSQYLYNYNTYWYISDQYRPPIMILASGAVRASSTFGHPNPFGRYINWVLLLNLPLTVIGFRKEIPRVFLFLVGISALVFTYSRGAWAGCLVGIAAFTLIARRTRLISIVDALPVIMVIGAVAMFNITTISERLNRSDHGSSEARRNMNAMARNMIISHPLVGIGGNTFENNMRYYRDGVEDAWTTVVHNTYLLIASECGVLGLIFFLRIYYVMIVQSYKGIAKSANYSMKILRVGACVTVIAMLVEMLNDSTMNYVGIAVMFISAAITDSMSGLESAARESTG